MNNISLFIALRYFRSKRSGFISIISGIAFTGIALGVSVLIIVTSVMNGFEKELQTRILQAVPHASVIGSIPNQNISQIIKTLEEKDNILGAAPYIETQGLISSGSSLKGVYIFGIDPLLENSVSIIGDHMLLGSWNSLQEAGYNLLIGDILAMQLGLVVGDRVNLLVPDTNLGLAGISPRTRQFTVTGIFNVGAPEIDQAYIYLNLKNASKLLRLKDSVHGIRIRYKDLFMAPAEIRTDLSEINSLFSSSFNAVSWTDNYGTLFKAIKNEKFLISLLLAFII
jgi:lipoprotein-releasing system permease protein